MKRAVFVFCMLGAAAGFWGCAEQAAPTMILASSKGGQLQFGYEGPGTYSFSRTDNTCIFRIGPPAGKTWVNGTVTLQGGDSNEVVLAIESTASKPYEVRLLGFASSADATTSAADSRRTIQIAGGNQTVRLKRFVIHHHDFSPKP